MKITSSDSDPLKSNTEMLCGFVLEGSNSVLGLGNIDSKMLHVISN